MQKLLLCIFALMVMTLPSLAGTIVLKNGKVIQFTGKYEIDGNFVRWKKNGEPFQVPLKVVNLEKCSQEDIEKKAPKSPEPEKPKEQSLYDQVADFRRGDELSLNTPRDNLEVDNKFLKEKYASELDPIYNDRNLNSEHHLVMAIAVESYDLVLTCLANNVEVEGPIYKDAGLDQPIHMAVVLQNPQIVKALVKRGANPDNPFSENITPLLYLLSQPNPNEEVALALVKGGADVSVIYKRTGSTPMHLAVYRKMSDNLIREMMYNSPVLNIIDKAGETPLSIAIAMGRAEIVNMFLEKGAKPNMIDAEENEIIRAALSGNTEIIDALLKYNLPINSLNKSGNSALAAVISRDLVKPFKHLKALKAEAIIDHENVDPLLFALGRGARQVADEIMAGTDNKSLKDLAIRLTLEGMTEGVGYLVENGISPDTRNADGDPLLILAAREGHLLTVGYLLEKGVDPFTRGKDGLTAHALAGGPEKDKIKELLKQYFSETKK